LREARGQPIREAVYKVFLLRIPREVFKRQHGERGNGRWGTKNEVSPPADIDGKTGGQKSYQCAQTPNPCCLSAIS
jgi:hypothetical protein